MLQKNEPAVIEFPGIHPTKTSSSFSPLTSEQSSGSTVRNTQLKAVTADSISVVTTPPYLVTQRPTIHEVAAQTKAVAHTDRSRSNNHRKDPTGPVQAQPESSLLKSFHLDSTHPIPIRPDLFHHEVGTTSRSTLKRTNFPEKEINPLFSTVPAKTVEQAVPEKTGRKFQLRDRVPNCAECSEEQIGESTPITSETFSNKTNDININNVEGKAKLVTHNAESQHNYTDQYAVTTKENDHKDKWVLHSNMSTPRNNINITGNKDTRFINTATPSKSPLDKDRILGQNKKVDNDSGTVSENNFLLGSMGKAIIRSQPDKFDKLRENIPNELSVTEYTVDVSSELFVTATTEFFENLTTDFENETFMNNSASVIQKIVTEFPWPVKKEAVVEGDIVLGIYLLPYLFLRIMPIYMLQNNT